MSDDLIDLDGGQTRMEAAYGSDDGDEDLFAITAKERLLWVQFSEQNYRPWEGDFEHPDGSGIMQSFRHHVFGLFRSKGHRSYNPFVRLTILVIFIGAISPIAMLFFSSLFGTGPDGFIDKMWGVNRSNLWGQVLGYFPRNLCYWPLLTALVVGGMISDDRRNGTSAIYFSRPVTRVDYTMMKYLSVAVVLGFVIIFSYMSYYTLAIIFKGEGWAFS